MALRSLGELYTFNSSNGDILGLYTGEHCRVIKGVTTSLGYSSGEVPKLSQALKPKP